MVQEAYPGASYNKTELEFKTEKYFIANYSGSHFYLGKIYKEHKKSIVKFSVFEGGAVREWDGYTLAFSHNIATAKPIALVTREQNPQVGLITEYIPGLSLEDEYTNQHLFMFGNELHKLHAIVVSGYGHISNSGPHFQSTQDYLNFWFDKLLPYIEKQSDANSLFKELQDAASQRIYQQDPRFIHGDPKLENVFKLNNNIKLIDFEWWQGGDPMDDLSVTLYHIVRTGKNISVFNQIIDGYFQDTDKMSDIQKVSLNFYLLLSAIKVISFSEGMNPTKVNEAYKDLDKIIRYIGTEHLFKIS